MIIEFMELPINHEKLRLFAIEEKENQQPCEYGLIKMDAPKLGLAEELPERKKCTTRKEYCAYKEDACIDELAVRYLPVHKARFRHKQSVKNASYKQDPRCWSYLTRHYAWWHECHGGKTFSKTGLLPGQSCRILSGS